jgi:hypothetical protein
MNRHVQETEGYVIRRVSGIITGFFVVSLITAPVLWTAGTGDTGSGTIEQPGGSGTGASGGTGTGPIIERPGSGTGGTESSAGKRGDGTSDSTGSGTGTMGSGSGSPGSGTGGAGTSR